MAEGMRGRNVVIDSIVRKRQTVSFLRHPLFVEKSRAFRAAAAAEETWGLEFYHGSAYMHDKR
jgi:hypothetical protein